MSPVSMVLEIVLVLLLAACLFYCWRLEQRLASLRSGQDGVRATVIELAQATSRAEAAVREMRQTAQQAGAELQDSIEEARRLTDRLGRLGSIR
jgi:cell division protein FtsB